MTDTAVTAPEYPEYVTTDQIRARLDVLQPRLTELAQIEGDFDDAQRSDWDSMNPEYDALTVRLADRRKRAERATAVATYVPGDAPAAVEANRAEFNVNVKPSESDIYDRSGMSVDNERDGNAYRDRALRSIESWRSAEPEWKESAERLVNNADVSTRDRQIAEHMLVFGHPDYVRAFNKFLRGGPAVLPLLEPNEARAFRDGMEYSRAMNEGSAGAGQAIVPPFLDPSIILTSVGTANPFRDISTVKTITTQTWKGVTSAGVTAEWTAEAAEMTDASPSLVQPSITPIRADAVVQASFEMLEDTAIGTEVAALFADARDRLESAAFATGTGSTQPYGVVTRLSGVTASRTAAITNGGPLQVADFFALDNNLPPRYRKNAQWAAAKGILNIIRGLATGPSQQQSAFWTDFGGGIPSKLIGYPVNEASGMFNGPLSTATASSDYVAVLGDFRNGYYIVDRIGMSVAYNPLVIGSNRRPTGEVQWVCYWRVGADTVSNSAFQVLVA